MPENQPVENLKAGLCAHVDEPTYELSIRSLLAAGPSENSSKIPSSSSASASSPSCRRVQLRKRKTLLTITNSGYVWVLQNDLQVFSSMGNKNTHRTTDTLSAEAEKNKPLLIHFLDLFSHCCDLSGVHVRTFAVGSEKLTSDLLCVQVSILWLSFWFVWFAVTLKKGLFFTYSYSMILFLMLSDSKHFLFLFIGCFFLSCGVLLFMCFLLTNHHLKGVKRIATFSWEKYKRGIAAVPLFSGIFFFCTCRQDPQARWMLCCMPPTTKKRSMHSKYIRYEPHFCIWDDLMRFVTNLWYYSQKK